MALTRKFLSALGIEEEKAEQIIAAHSETVEGLKTEKDQYKADAEALKTTRQELDELKKKVDGEDPYKEKFEKIKKEYDDFKADTEAKATTAKKEKAYRKILKEIGIPDKRIDTVMKVSADKISKIELDEQGEIKESDKEKEALKKEWSDFITTTRTEGAPSQNPPSNTGKGTMTKEQIRAIEDPIARQKAMLENGELFGLTTTSN